jgi:hypothetical protein
MVSFISTWDPNSLVYCSTMVKNYPWYPDICLYTLITSIEDNAFIKGMECSVAREVVCVCVCWGGGGGMAHNDNSGGHSM